jgi:alkanesulfonate monooxygenase
VGYDATLLAQHTINPRGDHHGQLEAWTASAALAAITDRIEIITAIKPLLYHPVVLAKQALQIEEISGGRFAINFVNAWFKPEIERAGITFIEHDERYAYGAEWLTAVKALLSGRPTTFHGQYFDIDGYQLTPPSAHRARPLIYGGGESELAREVISAKGDVFFLNGRPAAEAAADVADLGARPREDDSPLRYAMSAFVIARATDEEAEAALQEAFQRGRAGPCRPRRAGHQGRPQRRHVPEARRDAGDRDERRHDRRPGRELRHRRGADRRLRGARRRAAHAPVPAAGVRDAPRRRARAAAGAQRDRARVMGSSRTTW